MEDLFAREQAVADAAFARLKDGEPCTTVEFTELAKEYRRLLRQARLVTRISDRTSVDLNSCKLDLQEKVLFDKLTGIYNRRYLDDNMARLMRVLASCHGQLSVLMVDVDFFKQFNDTYGHEKGDECLQMVTQALQKSIPKKDDFAVRYGGEEFAVVLPRTGIDTALSVANSILQNVQMCAVPHAHGTEAGCVTVSVGVTTGTVNLFHTAEDYIRAADTALYDSKRNGRNRYTFLKLEDEIK